MAKQGYPKPTTPEPDMEELEEMANEGYGVATDGCDGIEPDGSCEHNFPAWTLYLGYV